MLFIMNKRKKIMKKDLSDFGLGFFIGLLITSMSIGALTYTVYGFLTLGIGIMLMATIGFIKNILKDD